MPKLHIKLPKHKRPWINITKWRQAEADLQALCQSNSAQVQSLASKLQETNLGHHELYTAPERQLRLEAQALRQAQEQEQQATVMTLKHELAIQEFRRQAEEQAELHKLLWTLGVDALSNSSWCASHSAGIPRGFSSCPGAMVFRTTGFGKEASSLQKKCRGCI